MFTDIRHWAEALLDWAGERGLPNTPEPPCSYSLDNAQALHPAGVSRQVLVEEGLVEKGAA